MFSSQGRSRGVWPILRVSACVGVGVIGLIAARLDAAPADPAGIHALVDIDPICEWLCDLKDNLCGTSADDGVERLAEGFTGEVDRATWDVLLPLMDAIRDDIDIILDPNQSPSLSPPDAGSSAIPVDTSNMTTEEIASEGCKRICEAKDASPCGNDPDHELIGVRLRQVYWLMDDLEVSADPG